MISYCYWSVTLVILGKACFEWNVYCISKVAYYLTQTCNARVKFDLIDRWGAFPGGRSSTQSVRAAGQCHWRGHRSDWIILGTNFSSGRKIPQWYRLFLPFELSCSLYEYYNIACAILDSYNGYNQLLLQMKIWSILTLFFNKRLEVLSNFGNIIKYHQNK